MLARGSFSASPRWFTHREEGSYDRWAEIQCPVLILCGQWDKMVPEQNSIVVADDQQQELDCAYPHVSRKWVWVTVRIS